MVRKVGAEQSREDIAPVFRNQVRLHTAILELGRLAAKLNAHL